MDPIADLSTEKCNIFNKRNASISFFFGGGGDCVTNTV